MNQELFDALETKISQLLVKYADLKDENELLLEENQRLQREREAFKARVDSILGKLSGI